jgi:putative transcriptional regulator
MNFLKFMHINTCYQNQCLVAMPHQNDAHFAESLVYICEHNTQGAMGLIINKPLPIALDALASQMGINSANKPAGAARERTDASFMACLNKVFYGGPCQSQHGFILHDGGLKWPSSILINEQLTLTSSVEILKDMVNGEGPRQYLLALGYAGWDAGQLENEMLHNVWLSTPATETLLFNIAPELRWQSAANSIGVDLNLLSSEAGYA